MQLSAKRAGLWHDSAGKLGAIKVRYGSFELDRWLKSDGDTRRPEEAWRQAGERSPFRCDLEGCHGMIGAHLMALPRSPAALVDDCGRADVLVLTFPKPRGCTTSARVLDYPALYRGGVHQIYLNRDGSLRIETVEEVRGDRPWSMAARAKGHELMWREYRRERAMKRAGNAALRDQREEEDRAEIDDGHPLYWFQ